MNEALKQRLVGAGVLLILAGLLWPLLFDFDEPVLELAPPSQIPPMAEVQAVIVQPASKSTTLKRHMEVKQPSAKPATSEQAIPDDLTELISNLPDPPPPSGKAKYQGQIDQQDRPRLDGNGIPVSFVVQVGTFKRWSNADSLRDKLIEKELKAYTRPTTSVSGGPYQVFVGPVLTYAQAEGITADVQSRFKVNDAIIKRFRSQQ